MDPGHAEDGGDGNHALRRQAEDDEAGDDGNGKKRRAVGRGGDEATEIKREHHGAGGNRAGEPGDKRRPPGQERGERPECSAKVDILAARSRLERGELGVGHRAGKRQQAAGDPRRQEQQRARNRGGDLRRREQDAAADDVGNDDRGGVKRAEAAFELAGRGAGSGRHARILTTKGAEVTKTSRRAAVIR
jgi:hypothetical protein